MDVEETPAVATRAAEPASQERANKWAVLSVVALGMFMATFSSSVVTVILPTIASDFGLPLSGPVAWVLISNLIMLVALQLTAGRLADVLGHKPLWLLGLGIFTVASVLCSVAPTLGLLIAGRALQGVGGALSLSISPAMLAAAFPRNELGRAMGWQAAIVGVGISIGPVLGGLIAEHLSWRAVFLISVPLGLLCIVVSLLVLTERSRLRRVSLDLPGAALLAIGLGSLTLGISFGDQWGWTSPRVVGSLAVAFVALVLVVPVERRVPDPIVDLKLFTNRAFTSANVSYLLSFLSLFPIVFILPFYFIQLRGFSVAMTSYLLTPFPLMMAVLGPVAGSLGDRFGTRQVSAVGLSLGCAGLLGMATFGPETPLWQILAILFVAGVGQGLFYPPNNAVLLGSVPAHRRGIASGMMATGRATGQGVGIAVVGAIFASLGGSKAGETLLDADGLPLAEIVAAQDTFIFALRAVFFVLAALAVAGICTTVARGTDQAPQA